MPRRQEEYEMREGSYGGGSRIYPNIDGDVQELRERESLKWKEIFHKVDRNIDGRIAIRELQNYIRTAQGEFSEDVISQDILEEVFERADRDQNGYLEEHEFMVMVNDHVLRRKHPDLHRMLSLAFSVVVPKSGRREAVGAKVEEFKCCPPPLLFVILSLVELGVFIYYAIDCGNGGKELTAEGPVPINSPLIYNPYRRYEAWRYISYMLIHSGYVHICSNILVQVALGIPLEMVHGPFRLFIVYMSGVVAGSLGTSISDPGVFLAGASGGVYALLTAHISSIILNWNEMEFAPLRLAVFVVYFAVDLGVAIYTRYFIDAVSKVGYAAHLAGAIAGLLIGINVLKNIQMERWEKYVWWVCLVLYFLLMGGAIAWNVFYTDHFRFPDSSPLQPGSCQL